MNRIDYSLIRYIYPEFSDKKLDYINNKIKNNHQYIRSIYHFYQIYPDFKCNIYSDLNSDLFFQNNNERRIIYHFLKFGLQENRPYKYQFITNLENKASDETSDETYDIIKNIKVSIIITLFNHRDYIVDCIINIIYQTHKNIEIIVVDDCSTDDSYQLVYNLIHSNSKYSESVRLLKTNTNSGCYVARNIAINHSTGDYIAFQDSDDLSISTRIEEILYEMILTNKLIGFSNIYRIKYFDIPNNISLCDKELIRLCHKDSNIITDSSILNRDLGIVTSIISRKLFDQYGLYNENMRHSSDLEFIERVYCLKFNTDPYSIHHMHTFIKENPNNLIHYSKKLNYICRKMTTNNNTLIYKEIERKEYMKKWKKTIYDQLSFY